MLWTCYAHIVCVKASYIHHIGEGECLTQSFAVRGETSICPASLLNSAFTWLRQFSLLLLCSLMVCFSPSIDIAGLLPFDAFQSLFPALALSLSECSFVLLLFGIGAGLD